MCCPYINRDVNEQNDESSKPKMLPSSPSYESAAPSYPYQDSNEQYNESAEPKS